MQSFSDIIQSDLFTFIVGSEQKPFIVHSNAIAATSDTFRALIRGGLSESKARCAELSDVEPEDFVRFLEFAYRRDYTVPPWVLDDSYGTTSSSSKGHRARNTVFEEVSSWSSLGAEASGSFQVPTSAAADDEEEEPAGPVIRADNPWDSFSPHQLSRQKPVKKNQKNKDRKRDTKSLRARFQNHRYLVTAGGAPPIEAVLEQCRPTGNSAPDQDFTPVFLGHARLYTFAEMRLIDPLKNLALYKLHATLLDFCLYERRVGDIVELARYAYDTGADRSESGKLNELRQLVVEYMACEMDTIGKHPAFQMLLEEGGEFVTDFWRIMSKWLLVT